MIFSLFYLRSRLDLWSCETGSAVVPSRVSLLISVLRLNLVLTSRIPPDFRGPASIYLFQIAIRRRVNPKFIGSRNIAYRWRSLSRVRRHSWASKPQGSSKRMLPWAGDHRSINIRFSFPHPLLVYNSGYINSHSMLKVPAAVSTTVRL